MRLDRGEPVLRDSERQPDPVAHVEPRVLPLVLDEADEVAREALGLELRASASCRAARSPPDGRTDATTSPAPMTVSSSYSPGSSAIPPAVTTPPSSDQSPDFAPAIAFCTSFPTRGPAARALTVRRRSTGFALREGLGAHHDDELDVELCRDDARRTAPAPRRPGTATSSDWRGWRTRIWARLRSACAAETTSRTVSIVGASSGASHADGATGQSVRCTERPPVSPRQISSVDEGSERRRDAAEGLEHGEERVEGVARPPARTGRAGCGRTSWSAGRGSPRRRGTRRARRRSPSAPVTVSHELRRLGEHVAVHLGKRGDPSRRRTRRRTVSRPRRPRLLALA